MNEFQKRLYSLSKRLDTQKDVLEETIQEIGAVWRGDWVVVKNIGEERRVIGFNLSERDAKLLAISQKPKVARDDDDNDFSMTSYQPMTEQEARKELLLWH